ncbi:MAG: adenosine deaminase [Anaerolineae bacterium]|nr:adenosine deaminase [Anaerolineae bacterium]
MEETHNKMTPEHNQRQDLWDWAHNLPKIDLHRHLEGSLRLETLSDLAQAHGICDLPSTDAEKLRPYVQITNEPWGFENFLAKFGVLRRFYTSKEAVQRIAREAILDAAADNVKYLELRFNPVALSRVQNFPLGHVVEWVLETVELTQDECGTRTCLIFQIGRDEPLSVADQIVDLAIEHFGGVVRGVDLAGNEAIYPADRFAPTFQRAKEAGLNITIHAGEAVDADSASSIRTAVMYLNAQRIGHGIRAIENFNVVQMLHDRQITLEVCPTSNLHTGVVRGMTQHPLFDLFNLGLRVTLNTDDPSVSATTLTDEYVVAVAGIGLEQRLIYRMLRNSADAAFIPEEERDRLIQSFRDWLTPYPGAVEEFDSAYKKGGPPTKA